MHFRYTFHLYWVWFPKPQDLLWDGFHHCLLWWLSAAHSSWCLNHITIFKWKVENVKGLKAWRGLLLWVILQVKKILLLSYSVHEFHERVGDQILSILGSYDLLGETFTDLKMIQNQQCITEESTVNNTSFLVGTVAQLP